jgi:uncharacterized protein
MAYIINDRGVRLVVKLSLLPKEPKFFAFYQQQAENIVKMAQQLKDLIYVWQNVKERAGVIADMEQDGDAITHDIMTLLYRTYITPFDREDISALAYSLDDISDRIHAVTDTLYLYQIKEPTEKARELCDIIQIAVLEVQRGVIDMSSDIRRSNLLKRCMTINQIENSGDKVHRAALAELFDHPSDMSFMVKWREAYKQLEATLDGCENFADILEGIAIKYT